METTPSEEHVEDNIRTSHSRIADTYYGGIGHGVQYYDESEQAFERWEGRMFKRIFDKLFAAAPPAENALLLDAGCGNGQWLEYFHRRYGFSNFAAVDFSREMLDVAKERMGRYPANIRYVEAKIQSIPLADEGVDFVHIFGVMDHVVDPEGVITEAKRILTSGGYLILNVPIRYSICHLSNLLLGISPEYWGIQPKSSWERLRLVLDFRSKVQHYRYYSMTQVEAMIGEEFEILGRWGSSYSYAISYAGIPYRKLPAISFLLMDAYDLLCRFLSLNHSAGMYWLCRKKQPPGW